MQCAALDKKARLLASAAGFFVLLNGRLPETHAAIS